MERIGDVVKRELGRGGSRDALALSEVTAAWTKAVGDGIAREAWPLRLSRDRTLHVATTSATWAFELDRMATEILEELRSLLGENAPARMRFAVGPVPEPAAVTDDARGAVERPSDLPPEIAFEAASAASAIEDPTLRELVARAAGASLLRARSGRCF